jgi:hypothetical protein
MPKKKKTSKAQKAQVKVRDLKPKKDAKGGDDVITLTHEPIIRQH